MTSSYCKYLYQNSLTPIIIIKLIYTNNIPVDYKITDTNKKFCYLIDANKKIIVKTKGTHLKDIFIHEDTLKSLDKIQINSSSKNIITIKKEKLPIKISRIKKNQFIIEIEQYFNSETLTSELTHYKNIMEFAVRGILIGNHEGIIIDSNEFMTELTGFSKDYLLGRHINHGIFTEQSLTQNPLRFDLLQQGKRVITQRDILKKDGTLITVEMHSKKMPDGSYQAIFHNITEQKEAERQVKESKYQLEVIFENSPLGLCLLNEQGIIVNCNTKFAELMGAPRSALYGFETLKNIQNDKLRNTIKTSISGTPSYFEDEYTSTIAGKTSFFRLYASPVNEGQNPTEAIGILEDIGQRKSIEKSLAAEREKLSVTLKSIGDGVITTDTEGNIEIINAKAEELTGWNSDNIKEHKISEIYNTIELNTKKMLTDPVTEILKDSKNNYIFRKILITKDSRQLIISDNASLIRNEQNQTIGVILVFRDITENIKLLENIQQNQKLESIGILAGGIAHDFNNLLAGFFGNINLAKIKSNNSEVIHHLDSSLNSLRRAKALTHQLLTFSKGGTPIRKQGALGPVINEIINFTLSGSNLSTQIEIADDLWNCEFDTNQISQVIENIIINAKQAMNDNGTIQISAQNITLTDHFSLLPDGNYIKITISDSGPGISVDIIDKIFDPFFTTKDKGTGLGLASSYSIIKQHGGMLEADKFNKKGAKFNIYLPASDSNNLKDENYTNKEHKGSGAVIVMDDDSTILDICKSMLEYFGYKVITVTNGREAIEKYEILTTENVNLRALILDLTIPGGMNGKETVEIIRREDSTIPIFVSSGYADNPVIANPLDFGFTDSITKPFSIVELSNLLNKYL